MVEEDDEEQQLFMFSVQKQLAHTLRRPFLVALKKFLFALLLVFTVTGCP